MKLLRWALAGASVYAVYRYSIGRKRPGQPVFVKPLAEAQGAPRTPEAAE
ncbi:hypothetical protein [Novosphingobium sp. JCM 18896]|nr:hypothetical protein [Novosphingobium sp. JCM 18896]MCW1432315.1 hypothetical protein [Novosphingobium sp. JCM 18896]